MNNLEAAGLLKVQEGGRAFSAIKQNLRLCTQEVDEKNPIDINYCYSGYAPLSVRLVEHIVKYNSWSGIEEVNENIRVTSSICVRKHPVSLYSMYDTIYFIKLVFLIIKYTHTAAKIFTWTNF